MELANTAYNEDLVGKSDTVLDTGSDNLKGFTNLGLVREIIEGID